MKPELMEYEILGNSVTDWSSALAVTLAVWIIIPVVKAFVLARLRRSPAASQPDKWQYEAVHLLRRTIWVFALVLGAFVGSLFLVLPQEIHEALRSAIVIVAFFQVALWLDRLAAMIADRRLRKARLEPSATRNAVALLNFMGRVAVWSLILLLMFANLGINITPLVTGLGIGGVAVALAAQNILGDLFASLAIVLDRPFEVGDFIIIGDNQLGTVERIGVKTTHIRSLGGEQLICSNTNLLSSRIHNYKRMSERRVVFSLGVTYDTPAEKMEAVPELLREIIEAQDQVRFDRAHFKSYGDFALLLEIVYWVLSPDYNIYMDKQQAINLQILKRFKDLGVEFAYPTQTLFVNRDAPAPGELAAPAS